MLTAVFRGHEIFVILCIVIAASVGLGTRKIAIARGWASIALPLWIGAITAVILLTVWSTGGSIGPRRCVVNHDLIEPFHGEQGLLNLAMFLPLGILGVFATHRFFLPTTGMVLLSGIIEITQGVFPALGRACDTSDLEMNGLGAIFGAAFAAILIRVWRFRSRRDVGRKWPAWGVSFGYAFVAMLALTCITPQEVSHTEGSGPASDAQDRMATQTVKNDFGDKYRIKSVAFSYGPHGTGTVTAFFNGGIVELTWPGGQQVTASLDPDVGLDYPVPGYSHDATTSAEALNIGTGYARTHAPWGIAHSTVMVYPIGKNAEHGWSISWRRIRNGVLMPMRLDMQIERSGHLSSFIMRKIGDPSLPPARISRNSAILNARACSSSAKSARLEGATLLAEKHRGEWAAEWLVVLRGRDENISAFADATSGKVVNCSTIPDMPSS